MKSSLEYWEKRWEEGVGVFDTGWPDGYARGLELEFLVRLLRVTPRTRIVEIGCGEFGLTERQSLVEEVALTPYFGMDGSETALKVARERFSMGTFECVDLTDTSTPLPHWERGAFLLSKRTIQNIHDEVARARLLHWIAMFSHGVLIEDFWTGRLETDRVRRSIGLSRLEIPEFNVPLNLDPPLLQLAGLWESPLGYYNLVTRAQPNVSLEMREYAYRLSYQALQEGRRQPLFGPVVAYVW